MNLPNCERVTAKQLLRALSKGRGHLCKASTLAAGFLEIWPDDGGAIQLISQAEHEKFQRLTQRPQEAAV